MEKEALDKPEPEQKPEGPTGFPQELGDSEKPGLSRRKVLLVGLATTPVVFSLFSKSAFARNNIGCSVATSIMNGTSLHPEVDHDRVQGWVEQNYEKYQEECGNSTPY